MKVASLVSYQIMPAKMGGQKGIYLFLKYLGKHCSVICYTTTQNIPGVSENFVTKTVLSNRRLRYINPVYFFKLKKDFKKEGITHLVLEQPYYGWLAYLLKKALGIKLILHSHNIEALRFKSMGKWWWKIMGGYEKWIHRKADFSFFISQEDRVYAQEKFKLAITKTAVITYGVEISDSPLTAEKKAIQEKIKANHYIPSENILLLFNGTLDYLPNRMALDEILQHINPILLRSSLSYTILICGSRLPAEYDSLQQYRDQNIVYAGFVDDVDSYFLATDIFINPVTEGGGIKTKLVESLAAGCSAVSYQTGAIGVPEKATGIKMLTVADKDAAGFANAIIRQKGTIDQQTPYSFFEHFYWGHITGKAADIITSIA